MEALFLATRKIVKKEGTNPNGESYNLLPTGTLNKFFTTPEGQVLEFKIQKTGNSSLIYIYVSYEHILDRDKDKIKKYKFDRYGGFCLDTEYEKYKNFKISLEELLNSQNWFDNNFQYAETYDYIMLERLEFDEPSKYFKQKKYTIIIEDLEMDLFNPEKYPINTIIVDTSINQLNSNSGKFFTKNIPAINSEEFRKQYYTKIITMICFRTYYIHNEILGILAKKDLSAIKQAVYKKEQLNNSSEYDNLFKIDKIIGNILKDWGCVDNVDASFLLEGKSLEYAEAYYNSISSFYSTLKAADKDIYFGYDNNDNPLDFNGRPITKDGIPLPDHTIGVATQAEKDQADNERRLNLLLKYLTTEGLGILDYDTRLAIVRDALNTKYLPQDDGAYLTQNNLLKVISSFANSSDADNFLNFLLEKGGEMLNFQNLYYKITEYYIQIDIPLIGIPVGTKELSRKVLVYILYAIWKQSIYNPNHIPSGVTPNQDGLNPNSFFLVSPGKDYFENADGEAVTDKSLEFEAVETDQDVLFIHYEVDKKFYNEKICIQKYEAKQTTLYQGIESKKDLWYHLFQPILILGYKKVGDNEKDQFHLPPIPKVPAFMFYYFKEFEEKYKTNALINFGVQVSVDLLLLYFSAGTSELAEMRYLKYLSDSGKVILNPSAYQNATKVIRLWKIINTAETISFTASTLANFAIYLSSTSTDQTDKEFYERVRNLAFLVMLGTGLGSLYAQTRAVKEAESILAMLSNPNLTIAVSLEAKNFLISLARSEKYLGAIVDKIDALLQTYAPTGTTNNIKSLISTFTKEEQLGFYFDFIQMHDVSKWLKMNEKINDEVVAIVNWKKLYNVGASDRTALEVIISKPKTNSMVKYYNEPLLKSELEAFGYERRWDFLNKVEDNNIAFNSYKAKPDLLKAWKRFHLEGNTRAVFLELEVTEQTEFLGKLGKQEFFAKIKANPDIIKSWKKYKNESSLKPFFDKYSDEELLSFHNEFKSDDILNYNRFIQQPKRLLDQRRYLHAYKTPEEFPRIFGSDIPNFRNQISNIYLAQGTNLFDNVNDTFMALKTANNGKWRDNTVCVAGFSHKDFPNVTFPRTNIHDDELVKFLNTKQLIRNESTFTKDDVVEIFNHFEQSIPNGEGRNLHPFLEARIEFHLEIIHLNQQKATSKILQRAGGIPVHAEIRSLNRLLHYLEENGRIIDDNIIKDLLGYVRKFGKDQVFPRCYDCCSVTGDIKTILLN